MSTIDAKRSKRVVKRIAKFSPERRRQTYLKQARVLMTTPQAVATQAALKFVISYALVELLSDPFGALYARSYTFRFGPDDGVLSVWELVLLACAATLYGVVSILKAAIDKFARTWLTRLYMWRLAGEYAISVLRAMLSQSARGQDQDDPVGAYGSAVVAAVPHSWAVIWIRRKQARFVVELTLDLLFLMALRVVLGGLPADFQITVGPHTNALPLLATLLVMQAGVALAGDWPARMYTASSIEEDADYFDSLIDIGLGAETGNDLDHDPHAETEMTTNYVDGAQ